MYETTRNTNHGKRLITDGGTAAASGGGAWTQVPGGRVGPNQMTGANAVFANGGGQGYDYLMANQEERAQFVVHNSALEHEEWKSLGQAVIETRDQQLNFISDLRGANLVEGESLATLVSRWQTIGDISEQANVGMGLGEPKSDEETPGYGMQGVPLPVFYKDWHIDRRFLEVSRNGPGGSLDTTVARQMTRALSNTIEKTMLDGWARPVDGYEMYGLRNHPDRNTVSGDSWHDDTNDQENIRNNLLTGIEAMEDDEYDNGGYWLMLNRAQGQRLRRLLDDFGGGNLGKTNMLERVNEEFETEFSQVRITKNLPDGEALIVAPEPDVIQLGVAEDIQPIEWESPSGSTIYVRLLGAMNLKLKSTQSGQMGAVHLTGLNA